MAGLFYDDCFATFIPSLFVNNKEMENVKRSFCRH